MSVQYNFKIEEELKEALEHAIGTSDASNKSDFLAQMLSAYTVHQASNTSINLDLTKYENVNNQTKDSVANAFKHILTMLDANFSTTTQEVIQLNEAQKAIEAKEVAYQSELEKLTADTTAEVNAIKLDANQKVSDTKILLDATNQENQELQAINIKTKEQLKATNQLAMQVQFITEENQELRKNTKILESSVKNQELETRKSIQNLEKQLAKTKEISLRQELELKHQEKETKSLEKRLLETQKNADIAIKAQKDEKTALNQQISSSQAELNQAIGKLEILNAQKPI